MILLLGATGFLGTHVLEMLRARSIKTRIVTRGASDWQDLSLARYRQTGTEVIVGDMKEKNIRERALKDCAVIINLIGTVKCTAQASFANQYVDLVKNLVEDASGFGIQRMLHVSCLCATESSSSEYFKAKFEAEQIMRQSDLYWTIFRPSFLFAERFPLLDLAKPLIKFKPFLPIIGSGVNRIQPVACDDVADCLLQSVHNQTMYCKSYDLVGPEVYTMLELLGMVRDELKLRGPIVNLPREFVKRLLQLIGSLPASSTDTSLIDYLTATSVSDSNQMTKNFVVGNLSFKQVLPKIIASY
jgi:uncharacterized protein YbjT (DUF2867 family)